jgi:hypothetical protein
LAISLADIKATESIDAIVRPNSRVAPRYVGSGAMAVSFGMACASRSSSMAREIGLLLRSSLKST